MDDELLVARARRGDQRALNDLLGLQFDRVYGLCRRMTGNDADAADAAQEALLAIVRGLPNFDGRSSFGTWCYRVASNACLDEMRRRKRRPLATARDQDREQVSTESAFDANVSERIDIDGALAQLPEEFRQAVVLRDLCGFDYADIAQTLGIPPGTVRSRIARGRSQLAELLGGNQTGPSRRRSSDHD